MEKEQIPEIRICSVCGEKFFDGSRFKRLDTVKGVWVCSDNCARDPSLRVYSDGRGHDWTLSWGIHRNTLMSRDVGKNYYADTREALMKEIERLKTDFAGMGYYLW